MNTQKLLSSFIHRYVSDPQSCTGCALKHNHASTNSQRGKQKEWKYAGDKREETLRKDVINILKFFSQTPTFQHTDTELKIGYKGIINTLQVSPFQSFVDVNGEVYNFHGKTLFTISQIVVADTLFTFRSKCQQCKQCIHVHTLFTYVIRKLAGLRYTTSEKSGPFWQSMLHNFLSRPLSFLGWTTAMLVWLDFHQTQSNLYKWFRMQRHDWSSTSPKEPMLHLSSSPCTGYQWQLASSSRHWCLHTERPQAQHPLTSTHYYESTTPPEVWDLLVSDALWYHHREAQNHSPEHSRSPFLAGGIIFPPLSGMLDPCQSSSNNWKLISFGTTWLHPKLKKINKIKINT